MRPPATLRFIKTHKKQSQQENSKCWRHLQLRRLFQVLLRLSLMDDLITQKSATQINKQTTRRPMRYSQKFNERPNGRSGSDTDPAAQRLDLKINGANQTSKGSSSSSSSCTSSSCSSTSIAGFWVNNDKICVCRIRN